MTRIVTGTCCDCGKQEQATYAGSRYRCGACTQKFYDIIRSMAEDGLSQGQIAAKLGCTQNNISRWCMKAGIVTNAASKQKEVTHGFGAAPDRLMPSKRALGAVSIFCYFSDQSDIARKQLEQK